MPEGRRALSPATHLSVITTRQEGFLVGSESPSGYSPLHHIPVALINVPSLGHAGEQWVVHCQRQRELR